MNNYFIIAFLSFSLATTLAFDVQLEWSQFKTKFSRQYESVEEESLRLTIFTHNLRLIAEHNELYRQRKSTFYLGINQFADMTQKEYTNTLKPIPKSEGRGKGRFQVAANDTVPDSIDWREYGYVTPVKDQGQCGSVQSFTITGAVEGAHAAASGQLASLSELNIDYCTFPFGDSCSGSLLAPDNLYEYVIGYGQDGEGCCPQYNYDTCFVDRYCEAATISYYTDVPSGDEDALKTACGLNGPVASFIDASRVSFQLYAGGIYSDSTCSSTQLDHGVVIAGYGSDGQSDYWLCKNSWGASWGEQGYIRMIRNAGNQCGIATSATWPTV